MADLFTALLANLIILAAAMSAQVATRAMNHGVPFALSSLDHSPSESVLEQRLVRAVRNQVEFLALLMPLILITELRSVEVAAAGMISLVLIASRGAYVLAVLAGIPFLRSALWLAGFGAWAMLFYAIL